MTELHGREVARGCAPGLVAHVVELRGPDRDRPQRLARQRDRERGAFGRRQWVSRAPASYRPTSAASTRQRFAPSAIIEQIRREEEGRGRVRRRELRRARKSKSPTSTTAPSPEEHVVVPVVAVHELAREVADRFPRRGALRPAGRPRRRSRSRRRVGFHDLIRFVPARRRRDEPDRIDGVGERRTATRPDRGPSPRAHRALAPVPGALRASSAEPIVASDGTNGSTSMRWSPTRM